MRLISFLTLACVAGFLSSCSCDCHKPADFALKVTSLPPASNSVKFPICLKSSEKPEMVERAMLVSIYFDPSEAGEKQAMLDELEDLVSNLGIGIAGKHLIKSRDMHAKFLCGTGKAQEVKQLALDCRADCVVFDNMLSPSQQREWERLVDECVIDREEVILDIFARRARTREASLQVELARMQYSLPRMARMWNHLDRQGGGSGGGKGGGGAARGKGKSRLKWTVVWRAPELRLFKGNWSW